MAKRPRYVPVAPKCTPPEERTVENFTVMLSKGTGQDFIRAELAPMPNAGIGWNAANRHSGEIVLKIYRFILKHRKSKDLDAWVLMGHLFPPPMQERLNEMITARLIAGTPIGEEDDE